MLARMWRKRNTPPLLVELQAYTTTLEISLAFPQKTGHSTIWGSAITLLGSYPEDAPTCNKDTCSTMVIEAIFIIARSWKEPRCSSTEKWIQKMLSIYTMEYYTAIQNNDLMEFLDKWRDLEDIILSKVSQSQKSTHDMHSLLSGNNTFKNNLSWAVVTHAFNLSTWEAEAGRFLSLRPAWSTEWVPGQPGLYRETLSWKNKTKKK